MSADSVVFWIFVAAWIVVGGLIVFVQLPRLIREASRIVRHVLALIEQSALTQQLAQAEADLARINADIEHLPRLRRRANVAVALIRATPLVPPALRAASRTIERELRAFTEAVR